MPALVLVGLRAKPPKTDSQAEPPVPQKSRPLLSALTTQPAAFRSATLKLVVVTLLKVAFWAIRLVASRSVANRLVEVTLVKVARPPKMLVASKVARSSVVV